MKETLFKSNRGNIRYYKIELFLSLFDDYIVEREYGNIRYKAPTGIRKNLFSSFKAAKDFYNSIIKKKKQRGYL